MFKSKIDASIKRQMHKLLKETNLFKHNLLFSLNLKLISKLCQEKQDKCIKC